jgi:hypothetical protein
MNTKEQGRIRKALAAAVSAIFGGKRNGFVAGASNVTPLRQMTRESLGKARERVESAEFGELAAGDLAIRLMEGEQAPEDADGCLADVAAILRGEKGPDALELFTATLRKEMLRDDQKTGVTGAGLRAAEKRHRTAPILESEKDGRLYAIAMLEALEEAGDENTGADAEGEDSPEGDRLIMNIYRTTPQATPARKWIEELYQYGTPDAIAGFYVVVSHYFGAATGGTPSLEHFCEMEAAGEWPPAGSVIYRDPKAAAAAIAAGKDQYEVTMTPAEIEQRAERERESAKQLEEYVTEQRELHARLVAQEQKRTPTPAEEKAAEYLNRTFTGLCSLDDLARRMSKTVLSFHTTYNAAYGIAALMRIELEAAAVELPAKHKGRKFIADALILAEAVRESLLNADDGSGEWNTPKAVIGAGMLAMVQAMGRSIERAQMACGDIPSGGYLTGDDSDPARVHQAAAR